MSDIKYTQEQWDEELKPRLERQKNMYETQLAELEEKLSKAKLLEDQQYEKLVEQLTGENTSIKEQVGKLTGDAEEYHKIMEGVLTKALEGLDEAIKKAVESLPGDVKQKLDWLTANRELFSNPVGDGVGSPASIRPGKEQPKNKYNFRTSRI